MSLNLLLFRSAVALLVFVAPSAILAQSVVLDVDLTKGSPGDKRFAIKGGEWQTGWNVTGDMDRMLIDVGRDIKNGYVEAVVTRKGNLSFTPQGKRNWMGVFAEPKGHQCPGGYARAGNEKYGFSKAEIFSSKSTDTICEKKFGESSDWVLDGKTKRVVRGEVRNNVMTWTNDKGGKTFCGSNEQPVTHFRYAMFGSVPEEKAGWHHGALVGLTVLRVKIVDYDGR